MKIVLRVLAIAVLAVTMAGCHAAGGDSVQAQAVQLKLYHVPAAQSRAIARNLAAVLESAASQAGTDARSEMRVTQPFPGTVMVLAPTALQASIASALTELADASGKPSSEASTMTPLRVQFWLVQAKAGSGEDSNALRILEPTLQKIRSSLGPSHFVLADSAAVSVAAPDHDDATKGNGSLMTSRGHKFAFHAVATPGTATVVLELHYSAASNTAAASTFPGLDTMVTMRPGEYVVLAGAPPATRAADAANATLMNFLVVRIEHVASDPR